ncbi:MAG: cell envelope integrity protein TolA [Nitrospirae bacterium]|nr:cell envelope integrity protein TolA [Nitrospirota bacterium]
MTAILSFLIHVTFIFIAVIVLKEINHRAVSAPYIVDLVGSAEIEEGITAIPEPEAGAIQESAVQPEEEKAAILNKKDARQYATNRIAALQATRRAKLSVGLRKVLSLKGSAATGESTTSEGGGEADILDTYYAKIKGEIWKHWILPETGNKGLEAIISITISQDGTIKKYKIEKGSGNPLFDRSALKAIGKASPVSPPPYEMEIGFRFTP